MRFRPRPLALAAALAMTLASIASAEVFQIDPVHSGVNFKVKHLFSMVPGRFKTFSGTIHYDAQNVEKSSVEVSIDAASITTDNEKRDGHLKSDDFFGVEKFPTIVFKSTKVAKKGEDKLEVAGDLTMRGITKPVTLMVDILGVGPGMGGATVAGFLGTARIDRTDYEVKWNRTLDTGGLLVGEDVMIELPIEAVAKTE